MTIADMQQAAQREDVAEVVRRARRAQTLVENHTQEQIDDAVCALAWSVYQPGRAEALAALAVNDTGLGLFADKVVKNRSRTLGVLQDLTGELSVGAIETAAGIGITTFAKPVGVVGAVLPSTAPAAAAIVKAMHVVKGRNSIIFLPSPKASRTCDLIVSYMREELERIAFPADLVQTLSSPISRTRSRSLMEQCDRIFATGSKANVRAAYLSGTPTIGTAAGNVTLIVDSTADIDDSAKKIKRSKTFDYGAGCSSENSIIVEEPIYEPMLEALTAQGAHVLSSLEKSRVECVLWQDGVLNRDLVARSPRIIAEAAGLSCKALDAEFFIVEETGVGAGYPFSGEKLSVILTAYRSSSFEDALGTLQRILDFMGAGHSCGVYTARYDRAERVAETAKVSNVLVNQCCALNNPGGFENGLKFTSSIACGSWGHNSGTGNVTYKDFLNFTQLVLPITKSLPQADELFESYLARYGSGEPTVVAEH